MARWRKSSGEEAGVGKAHSTWCPLLGQRMRIVNVRGRTWACVGVRARRVRMHHARAISPTFLKSNLW